MPPCPPLLLDVPGQPDLLHFFKGYKVFTTNVTQEVCAVRDKKTIKKPMCQLLLLNDSLEHFQAFNFPMV
jgi:hypothetical protein